MRLHPACLPFLTVLLVCQPVAAQNSPPSGAAEDRPLRYGLRRLFALGGSERAGLELGPLYPQDVTGVRGARLLLLDRAEWRLVVVDSSGVVERTFGRRGRGPGELSYPGPVSADPAGFAAIWDLGRSALLRYDAAGTLTGEARLTGLGLVQGMRVLGPDELLSQEQRRDSLNLVHRRGGTATLVANLVLPPARSVRDPGCRLTDWPVRPLFSPELLWDHRAGLTVFNADGSFSVAFRQGDGTVTTARRATQRRRSSQALARASLDPAPTVSVAGGPPCALPAERILAVAEIAPTLPAYSRLLIAPDMTVWAIRYRLPSERASADLYRTAEGYIGTVVLGSANPLTFRTDGALVSLETDADGTASVVVYDVLRRP